MRWSYKEMLRVNIIEQLVSGKITRAQASESLELSVRQVSRMSKAFNAKGAESLRHKGLGRRAHNKIDKIIEDKILEVFFDWKRNSDDGVNASHLRDILFRDHKIDVSRQTCWRLLRSRGLTLNTRRVRKHRKKRERRESEGDLLYLDGSPHRWLGESKDKITLVLCSDDATTGVLAGRFAPEENRNICFEVTHEVCTKFGLPRSFWLDRASQFITTRHGGVRSNQTEGPTHWQNAMYDLGIRCIFAHSPQARGRGERINGSFQERLCAELQYNKIKEIKAANDYLTQIFIPDYNKRCAVEPTAEAVWRKPPNVNLKAIFSARFERRVMNDNTIKHMGRRFQLLFKPGDIPQAGRKLELQEWFDGTIHIFFPNDYSREYAWEEIYQEPRQQSIKGITDDVHLGTLFKHVYY